MASDGSGMLTVVHGDVTGTLASMLHDGSVADRMRQVRFKSVHEREVEVVSRKVPGEAAAVEENQGRPDRAAVSAHTKDAVVRMTRSVGS